MLSVVVSFSSNELAFLKAQVRQLLLMRRTLEQAGFQCRIAYSMGSRLFDLSPEVPMDSPLLKDLTENLDDTFKVIRYEVGEDVLQVPRKYHNLARRSGVEALAALGSTPDSTPDSTSSWFLFLDADEIPDGVAFGRWFAENSKRLSPSMAYKLACHWYFMKPTWQATELEDSILLVNGNVLNVKPDSKPGPLDHPGERDGIVAFCRGGCMRRIGEDSPMFHHFSWVRTEAQVLHKVRTWGHRFDRVGAGGWEPAIRAMWSATEPPPGGDFIHGYRYRVVPDQFSLAAGFS
jgi:hypothetical protein